MWYIEMSVMLFAVLPHTLLHYFIAFKTVYYNRNPNVTSSLACVGMMSVQCFSNYIDSGCVCTTTERRYSAALKTFELWLM